jgi:type I restriction enzyme, S subunit
MKSGFSMVPLREVAHPIVRPETPRVGTIYRQIGVRLWGEGAYERESIDGSQTRYQTLSRVENDDIIVNKIWARNGSVAVVTQDQAGCFGSNEFPTFVPDHTKLEPRWFHWLTKTKNFWERCDEKSQGTSGKNRIRPEQFLEVAIPLPPLEEQQRIVARIEELATRIEEARGLRSETMEVKELLSGSIARALFVDCDEVNYLPLQELVTVHGGGTPSKSNPFFWQGTIPWVSPKDMKVREISNSIDHISEEATKETAAKLIDQGTVVIVTRGMILAHTVPSAILRVPATINQDMKALTPCNKLLPEYLCITLWALNHELLDLIEKSTHDTRKLETTKLLKFKIPLPSIPEQRRIVAYLDGLQARVDALKQLQAETQAELDALLPSILDKAFKGELV